MSHRFKDQEGEFVKEELYEWIKDLAVFYILFTAILHLVPDGKYEKYIRFFMGLLLIVMMSTPVFSILGKGQELAEDFQFYFDEENQEKEIRELENLQKLYLEKGYALELAGEIKEDLKKSGIEVQEVQVKIEGEKAQAALTVKGSSEELEGRIADELMEKWGFEQGEYTILDAQDDTGAVDRFAASGSSSGSGGDAGIR